MMKTLTEMMTATQDAYSRDNYTDSGWKKSIQALRDNGLTDDEVIGFLYSKHIRWAADSSSFEYGQNDESTILNYISKYPDVMDKNKLAKLIL